MNEYLDLFVTFARIGGFTFGGGYAMLPILEREVVDSKKWVTQDQLYDYYAIGQCTPGVIAVNTATFIGYKKKGIPGAIVATLGVVFPSLVIIMIITALLQNFASYPAVQHALAGIRVCVCILVLNAIVKLAKKALVDKITVVIFAAVLACSLFTDVQTFLIVIAAGVAGIIIKTILSKKNLEKTAGGGEK